jgi:hypothetical protein
MENHSNEILKKNCNNGVIKVILEYVKFTFLVSTCVAFMIGRKLVICNGKGGGIIGDRE